MCTKYYLLLLKLCCQKLTITQKLFSLHSGLLEFQNIMQRGGVWIWRLEHLPLRIARHFDGTSLYIWVKNLSIMYQYITEICVWCWFFFFQMRRLLQIKITFSSPSLTTLLTLKSLEVHKVLTPKKTCVAKENFLEINYAKSSDVFNACWIGA